MSDNSKETTEMVIFQAIAEELPGADHRETHRRLKRKIERRNLGRYDQNQVSVVRALHDELETEISKGPRSIFYRGEPGGMASPDRFDIDRIVDDYHERYRMIARGNLYQLVNFAIYLYYLR